MPTSMTLRSRRRVVSSDGSAEPPSPIAGGRSTSPIDLTDEDDVTPELDGGLRTPSPIPITEDEILEWTVKPSLRRYVGRIRVQRNQPESLRGEKWRTTKQIMDFLNIGPEEHAAFTAVISQLIEKDTFIRRFDGKSTPRAKKDQVCQQLTQHLFDHLDETIIRRLATLPHDNEEIGFALWSYFLDRRNSGRSREVYQERKNLSRDDDLDESAFLREIHAKKRRYGQVVQPWNSPSARGVDTPRTSRFDQQEIIDRVSSPLRREISPIRNDIFDLATRIERLEENYFENRNSSRDLQAQGSSSGNNHATTTVSRASQTTSMTPSHYQQPARHKSPDRRGLTAQKDESSFTGATRQTMVSRSVSAAGFQATRKAEIADMKSQIANISRNQQQEQRDKLVSQRLDRGSRFHSSEFCRRICEGLDGLLDSDVKRKIAAVEGGGYAVYEVAMLRRKRARAEIS
ncbi:hypothetical protein TWF696_008623 [Orbilia brochopaga]|uniref:Uncharacterized protein n=1 Tax=Orbilia brochopaga TaxID=3140254 RepID=A0AAV9UHB5_9PEZI